MARERKGKPETGSNPRGGSKEYPGRTVRGTASSYSSVGGKAEKPDGVEQGTAGPVHDITFRPGPGGAVEEIEPQGLDIPYAGEAASTRGASFAENPDTGLTPEEERDALLTESFEKRARRHESG